MLHLIRLMKCVCFYLYELTIYCLKCHTADERTTSYTIFIPFDYSTIIPKVCCLAAEARDPNRVLPLAVFGTITIVTVFYCLASLALVGMQDYRLINVDSGFSEALKSRGWQWAQHVVAIGEIEDILSVYTRANARTLSSFLILLFIRSITINRTTINLSQ